MGMLARMMDFSRSPVARAVSGAVGGLLAGVRGKAVSLTGDYGETDYGGFGRSLNTQRNTREWIQTYKRNMLLGSVIGRISEDVARGQYRFYEIVGESDDGQLILRVVHHHPFWSLWQDPNPDMDGHEFRKLGMEYLENNGLWFSWIQRDFHQVDGMGTVHSAGDPKHIWAIEPWNVNPRRPTIEDPFWRVKFKGRALRIPVADVVYIRYIDPEFPYRLLGASPSARVADDIAGYEFASQWNLNVFRNGGIPGNIIGLPTTKENAEAFKVAMEAEYAGNKNSSKNMYVPVQADGKASVTVTPLGKNHRELDYGKGMEAYGDHVCQNWNMPPTILGRGGKADRTLGETDKEMYAESCVEPRMSLIVDQFNRQLVHEFEDTEEMVLGFISPVKETEELKSAKANDGLTRGGITLNQYRKSRGEDPLSGGIGDALTVPANTVLIDSNWSIEEAQQHLAARSGATAPQDTKNPSTPTSPGSSSFTPAGELTPMTQSVSAPARTKSPDVAPAKHRVSVGGQIFSGRVVAPVVKVAPGPSLKASEFLELIGVNGG